MSDYTYTTQFGQKDTLIKGDAAKILRGVELDTEFNAIEASGNTKVTRPSSGIGQLTVIVAGVGGNDIVGSGFTAGAFATLVGNETLTNKTLTAPVITGGTSTGQTITNPTITGATFTAITLDAPNFKGTPTFDSVAAQQAFMSAQGVMNTIRGEASFTPAPSTQIIDIVPTQHSWDATSNIGTTTQAESAIVTNDFKIPKLARWARLTGSLTQNNAGRIPTIGVYKDGVLQFSATAPGAGLAVDLSDTLSLITADEGKSITVKVNVDSSAGSAFIINLGIEIDFF